jgi:hypothetical protein
MQRDESSFGKRSKAGRICPQSNIIRLRVQWTDGGVHLITSAYLLDESPGEKNSMQYTANTQLYLGLRAWKSFNVEILQSFKLGNKIE